MTFSYLVLHAPHSIRLLSFKGTAQDGETIQFSLGSTTYKIPEIAPALTHKSKNNGKIPVFDALSYAWGDSTLNKTIICNGARTEITRNLYDALTELTSQFPKPQLWVDSLCIDQSNMAEKVVQVAMIGGLYASASNVICWLGTGDYLPPDIPYRSEIGKFIKIRSSYCLETDYPTCERCKKTVFRDPFMCKNETHQRITEECNGLEELIGQMEPIQWFERV